MSSHGGASFQPIHSKHTQQGQKRETVESPFSPLHAGVWLRIILSSSHVLVNAPSDSYCLLSKSVCGLQLSVPCLQKRHLYSSQSSQQVWLPFTNTDNRAEKPKSYAQKHSSSALFLHHSLCCSPKGSLHTA